MNLLRWHSVVAAAILVLSATPMRAQNLLEQLEAKLLQQEQIDAPKAVESNESEPRAAVEKLPGPAAASSPSLESEAPYLGMTLERPVGGGLGLRVVEVADQSPAWKSGFRVDDRVLAIAGHAVSDIDSFAIQIAKFKAQQTVQFLVDRRGRQLELHAVLAPIGVAVKTLPPSASAFEPRSNQSIPRSPSSKEPIPLVPQAMDGRGSLGIVLAPLSDAFRRQFGIPVYRGASVLEVAPNSPGFLAGLAAGDCIVDIDGRSIQNDQDVVRWKQDAIGKASVSVRFYRGAQLMQTIVQLPSSPGATYSADRQTIERSDITPDMLTPEYIRQLRSEIAQLRAELVRSQNRVQSLERQIVDDR